MHKDQIDYNKIPTLQKFALQIKPNPNNWIIIQKWNHKLFKKYQKDLFNEIYNYLENIIYETIEEQLKNFADIKHI